MRTTYRVLAFVIAAEVVVQAAMMAFAVAGLGIWVDKDGGVLDKATMEGDLDFTGVIGFAIHGMNGMMVIPVIALAFLIVSFFANVPGGVKWAGFVVLAVALQVTLGLLGHENAIFGLLHGVNALIIFSLALMAGKRVSSVATDGARLAGSQAV